MAKQHKLGLRRPHARKPFQQGDLDGLCGVYSIVNTVRILCPEVDLETAEYLFDILMQKLLRTAVTPFACSDLGHQEVAVDGTDRRSHRLHDR